MRNTTQMPQLFPNNTSEKKWNRYSNISLFTKSQGEADFFYILTSFNYHRFPVQIKG
jgi:hypothetical protein